MSDPMRIRATRTGATATIKILMAHPMETGQRKDADGRLVPAWFIQMVTVSLNDRPVLTADWGPAVSKNPFLQLQVTGTAAGDRVSVTWQDSRGDTRTDEVRLA